VGIQGAVFCTVEKCNVARNLGGQGNKLHKILKWLKTKVGEKTLEQDW